MFTFGDAAFAGTLSSTFGGPSPDGPAVGIAANPTGAGYLIATAQGAIVSYGGAPFFGSPALSGVTPAEPLVSVTYEPGGTGYWAIGADGGVFAFNSSVTTGTGSSATLVTTGNAHFFGSVPGELGPSGIAIPDNVVGIRADPLRPAVRSRRRGRPSTQARESTRRAPRRRGSSRLAPTSLTVGASCGVTRRRRRR